jgi:purine-binding chemotaxis protein CheW
MSAADAAAGNGVGIRQFATFRVADMFMGIELARVQELLRYQEMTWVPLAAPMIAGLINLRGQIVTVVDMRRILGLAPVADGEALPMNIVIHSDGGPVSILVDEICDVLDVPIEASTPIPANLPPEQREFLEGVYQLGCGLLLVIRTERILAIDGSLITP